MAKTKRRKRRGLRLTSMVLCLTVVVMLVTVARMVGGSIGGPRETEEVTLGIDVARYQGTIDWEQVAGSGIDFALVRLGYRDQEGQIVADSNAAYNLQQAHANGIKLGAYFFSTAVTKEEAIEEADWVADFLAPYPITYPVAYNCEGYGDMDSRQYLLDKFERTTLALEFLKQIEKRGYEAMFYASKNEMEGDIKWQVSRIEPDYKVWVAQYTEEPYPATEKSDYSGAFQMWQYTDQGTVPGISQPVDLNVAWFGYEGTNAPQSKESPEPARPDPEALMEFSPVEELVTAKEETNLRSIPSQGEDAEILHTLKNGETARRTGISSSGWSRVEYEGQVCYAVTSYLTTNLSEEVSTEVPTEDDGIDTEFRPVSDSVTAKDVVNLRSIPSYTREDSVVVVQLKKGEVIRRTGINEDVGWSRVEYQGQTLYCITSYLEVVQ